MKKNIAIFLNSPYLGGAERSIIAQCLLIRENADFTFVIPSLLSGDTNVMIKELNDNCFTHTVCLKYPKSVFSFSRFGVFNGIKLLIVPFGILIFYIQLFLKISLKKTDIIWCNGNKIATLMFFYCYLVNFKNKFFWHFRDYPTDKAPFCYLWKIVNKIKKYKFVTISNSHSVQKEVVKAIPNQSAQCVYNPIGQKLERRKIKKIECIGVVSMMAPWKGVHQILYFTKLYKQELKGLGIKSIKIFGGDLYRTGGAHQGYEKQLHDYAKKHKLDLIQFEGIKPLPDIYSSIDCLFHTSLSKEPFGRVIVEAYSSGVPVFSTGMGGAGELVFNNKTGHKIFPYHYEQWLEQLKNLCELEDVKREQMIEKAYELHQNIAANIGETLNKLILA